MRINLAKIVPGLVVIAFIVISVVRQSGGSAEAGGSSADDSFHTGTGTSQADAFLDEVAIQLAQPGVYVAPGVSEIDQATASELNQLAAQADGPQRIAVINASRVQSDDAYTDPGAQFFYSAAYQPEELVGQLYDRVGQDGVYAILSVAPDSNSGRSFYAYQWAEEGPTYQVENAVDAAIDCCAPNYDSMVESFITEAQNTAPRWGLIGVIGIAILSVFTGIFSAITGLRRRRAKKAADAEVVRDLRGPLNEEVIELSNRVAMLPSSPLPTPAPAGAPGLAGTADPVAEATRKVLDLVEAARQRLDAMTTESEAEGVVSRLADARYQLVVIDALRAGQPAPARTVPCFIDPRHGPSVDKRKFTPEGGAEREVEVCGACRDSLDAGMKPQVRMIERGGRNVFYWDAGNSSRPYVRGYWQRHRYPDEGYNRRMNPPAASSLRSGSGSKPFEFVWDSSSSGGGWGGGGGSSRRSSSRRSGGGGRSSRSSSRGGGGRRF